MADLAADVARAAGRDDEGRQLLAATRHIADRCAVDPRADLGMGEVHFPEFDRLPATPVGRRPAPARCR